MAVRDGGTGGWKAIAAAMALGALMPCSVVAQGGAGSVTSLQLQRVTQLPHPVQMHGSTVVAGRLYIFGGNVVGSGEGDAKASNYWSDEVFSAPIQDNGQLGEWRPERRMPERRSYLSNSVQAVGRRIYILGGGAAPAAVAAESALKDTANALWTTVGADGSLSEWQRTPDFPGQRVSCAASCASPNALYLLGGSVSKAVTNQVVYAALAEDGSVEKWQAATPLPSPLWFHGAAWLQDRVYVWGGLTKRGSDAINSKVWSAPVRPDRSLGEWQEEEELFTPVYSSAYVGYGEHLLSIGGRYRNGYPTESIWYTRMDGVRPGKWSLLRTDLEARIYTAAAMDPSLGAVYVTGGRFRPGLDPNVGRVLNTVQAFSLR